MSIPFPPELLDPAMLGIPPMPPPMGGMAAGPAMPPGMPAMPPLPPDPLGMPMGMGGPGQPPLHVLVSQLLDQQFPDDEEGQAPPEHKKKRTPKPSDTQIRERIDRTVQFWDRRDRRMDEDLELYRLVRPQRGVGEVVIRNTPYIIVEKAAAMIASQKPTISIIPHTDVASETSQKVENFARWSWNRWNKTFRKARIQGSLWHTLSHFLALRGWAAVRLSYDSENENPREHPVTMTPYDPRQVYPSVGNKGLRWVVHEYYTTVGELIEEWPEAEKEYADRDSTEIIKVQSYYDDFWHHVVAEDGILIKPTTAHDYGYNPWLIVTGYGSPIRATTADQQMWTAEVGVSIFHSIRDSYKQLNRVLSQIATEVAKSANPPTAYYYDPANEDPKPLDFSAGATNYLFFDRERVEPLDVSPKPANVGPLVDSLLDDVERGSLPRILWGVGVSGSGFTSSILTDAARDNLFPLVEAMQEVQEQVTETMLCLIKDLHDGEVGFYQKAANGQWRSGITITPEEIEEIGTEVVVKYRDISPKDRAMMANLAAMLTDKKLVSLETARDEFLNLENPERENDRVISEFVNMDEKVLKDVLVPLTLEQTDPKMAMLWAISKMHEEMAGQQGGCPPGPGGPPGGPPEMPGMAGPPGGPPGLPPDVMPPIMQPGADQMAQSLGSLLGGMGMQSAPGIPGAGAPPLPLPIM